MNKNNNKSTENKKFSRRDFLIGGTSVVAAEVIAGAIPGKAAEKKSAGNKSQEKTAYAESKGYLVYDSKKCAGCTTCMLACSLAHEGKESLSLSRIQIMQNSFAKFPYDIKIAVCRQCVTPVCVQNCPTGACFIDGANGNIRRIDADKCIGCKECISSCPQQPNRTVWNPEIKKSMKCDLCLETPYWNEKGGPTGKQACVESCPMQAVKFVTETPEQGETDGYDINLRNIHWQNLGLVENSSIIPPVFEPWKHLK